MLGRAVTQLARGICVGGSNPPRSINYLLAMSSLPLLGQSERVAPVERIYMYVSPIEKIYGDIQSQMIENDENLLMCSVTQSIGYKVDKDELIKALQYDRHQYEQGYYDGAHMVMTEENLVDWMTEYIKAKGIKPLMELVMKAIELEKEREKTQ